MAGPPVTPPTLSYKSKAQWEQEEREEREREERERQEREREREEMEQVAREVRAREAAAKRGREAALMRPPEPSPPPAETEAAVAPPPPPAPRGPALFEEDEEGPDAGELETIEMLEADEDWETVEEAEEGEAEAEAAPRRAPPRPPKSPDMRPVFAGFLLVGTGLVQFVYGIWAMIGSPDVASGPWAPLTRWGAFSLGFSASFLGLLAIRGGLWSFRKERFDVVKIGAIAASVCIWAWWIPWAFGFAALLIVHKAKTEYYPYYDPRWDAPSWATPPPRPEGDEEEAEEDAEGAVEGVVMEAEPEETDGALPST